MEDNSKEIEMKQKAIETETSRLNMLMKRQSEIERQLSKLNNDYYREHNKIIDNYKQISLAISNAIAFIENNKKFINKNS